MNSSNIDVNKKNVLDNKYNHMAKTSLDNAMLTNRVEIVKLLLDNGANIYIQNLIIR